LAWVICSAKKPNCFLTCPTCPNFLSGPANGHLGANFLFQQKQI
jgi:hypothetical protein